MGPIDPKGTIAKLILAGMLACVASWAGLIVLLVWISMSPGNYVAAGVLLAWAALTAVVVATGAGTRFVPLADSGWQGVVLAPAVLPIVAGIYVWQRTQPFRQSRADRRRLAGRAMHDRRL
jgi:hypothetical protein